MFEHNRSKKVELLAKVYDHAKHYYKFGFRILTLSRSDGSTFLPVNSVLLSTENNKNRINEAEETVNRVFTERAVKYTRFPLHIHASIQKNETEQVSKHFDYWDSLHLCGITFNYTTCKWFMPFLWAKVLIFQASPHQNGVGSLSKLLFDVINFCQIDS